jgi:PucR C-terminal helix-turn-helix domain/GGDEF-like domain
MTAPVHHDGVSPATIRRIEQASGALATRSVARMDEHLAWFRALPAEQRSWVTVVAQAGIAAFVEWMKSPGDVMRLTGNVFGAAPRELARRVSLQQTVELVRETIAVAEEQVSALAEPGEEQAVEQSMLRFSREIAFAAAQAYAGAAESRGAWDARLEALVIDDLVRGGRTDAGQSPSSQLVALGWGNQGAVTALVGTAPTGRTVTECIEDVRRVSRRAGLDALAGIHGGRLVVVLGGVEDPDRAARIVLGQFADEPVVMGGLAASSDGAGEVTRAALSGYRAVAGWPGAPRPVSAAELLPERVIAGDEIARRQLIETVYEPLLEAGQSLLGTVETYLDNGRALESTARALFVHPNTVRYRLKRAADVCGHAPTEPRGALTITVALMVGRLSGLATSTPL